MRWLIGLTLLIFWLSPIVAPAQSATAVRDSLADRMVDHDEWLAEDKAFHLASSAFLTAGGFYFFHQEQDVERNKNLRAAAGVALVLGIAKEVYDKRHPDKHVASWKDLAADAAGIAASVLILSQ